VSSRDTVTAMDVPVPAIATEPLARAFPEPSALGPITLPAAHGALANATTVAAGTVAGAGEIRAPRTVPLAPALLAASRRADPAAASPNRRLATLVVVAFVLFAVGVLVGRTFLFR
jgi:hypothetical protein